MRDGKCGNMRFFEQFIDIKADFTRSISIFSLRNEYLRDAASEKKEAKFKAYEKKYGLRITIFRSES